MADASRHPYPSSAFASTSRKGDSYLKELEKAYFKVPYLSPPSSVMPTPRTAFTANRHGSSSFISTQPTDRDSYLKEQPGYPRPSRAHGNGSAERSTPVTGRSRHADPMNESPNRSVPPTARKEVRPSSSFLGVDKKGGSYLKAHPIAHEGHAPLISDFDRAAAKDSNVGRGGTSSFKYRGSRGDSYIRAMPELMDYCVTYRASRLHTSKVSASV
jgi:hypothetical protein